MTKATCTGQRYLSWICVLERSKSGRLHFHLLVVCREDIRSGFDFAAVKRRDYRSASEYLRGEWAFWRKACPKHNFGRCELLPVKKDGERAAGYIGKHLRARYAEDKRARLVIARHAQPLPRARERVFELGGEERAFDRQSAANGR